MLGLRTKLLFGFGGLLLIVLVVSVLAQTVMEKYSEAINKSYREDYDSVFVCQQMKETIERMDQAAQNTLAGKPIAAKASAQLIAEFESRLETQHRDATLPGETAATEELSRRWATYLSAYSKAVDAEYPPSSRGDYYQTQLFPRSMEVKAAAQKLIDMNLAGILNVPEQAQKGAIHAHWAMRWLTISALVLSLIFAGVIGRIILRPVRALTNSVHEVEQGNFNSSVNVQSKDELGTLAAAFNNMAEKLRLYRQLAEDRLARTERTTQLAIDSLPDAVLVVSPGGEVELANQVARQLLKLSPKDRVRDFPGKWLTEVWMRTTGADHSAELRDYGSIVEFDVQGETRQFLPRSVPILNDTGKPIGATIVLADVTGLRRLDAMKNSLLSLVSHELKTPLTSARMVLHLVTDQKVGPLSPRQQELLAAAREDTDRLHRIVEDLLDMSRIESGRALMDLRLATPESLVKAAPDTLGAAFQSQQVALNLDVEPGLPPIPADPARIGHVFVNLLMNALRHTPAGGNVTVGARRENHGVEFFVADTGCGIPRQYLPRIGEKFFRVPGQPSSTGSGLGLAIAKDIVEAHHGRLQIDSTEGAGTRVSFTLHFSPDEPQN